VREAALALVLAGASPDALPLEPLGWEWLRGPLRVAVAGPGAAAEAIVRLLAGDGGRPTAGVAAAAQPAGGVVAVLADRPEPRAAVEGAFAAGPAGGSGPCLAAELPDHLVRARRALAGARDEGIRWHGEAGRAGLLAVVDPEAGAGFAEAVLAPLAGRRHDLLPSLEAWLAHNGQWDVAAASLGVHRHTLRYRIRRAEELLGRPLDDAGTRAELWYALRLLPDD
jgi:purine catabolism regulator